MQNGTKLEEWSGQIFDIIHSLSLYMLVQGSHSIATFAAHALRDSIIATYNYIRCTYNTHIQYRRSFPYRADRSARMEKIAYIVCTCKSNNYYY